MIRAQVGNWAEPKEKTCGRKSWSAPHSRGTTSIRGTPPHLVLGRETLRISLNKMDVLAVILTGGCNTLFELLSGRNITRSFIYAREHIGDFAVFGHATLRVASVNY